MLWRPLHFVKKYRALFFIYKKIWYKKIAFPPKKTPLEPFQQGLKDKVKTLLCLRIDSI